MKENFSIKMALMGDVMLGRMVGEWLEDEPPAAPWGNLLPLLANCDLRLLNLENGFTICEKTIEKVFHFKADPKHVSVLKAAHIDLVNLANNHILDFTEAGCRETLTTLNNARIAHVGAGLNLEEASQPAVIHCNGMTIGILGFTDNEPSWKASAHRAGTNYLHLTKDWPTLQEQIRQLRPKVDFLIVTVHWGPNMRSTPSQDQIHCAYCMLDEGVDLIHGHSAHVFQAVEVKGKQLILYDTGDFIDDYAVDPLLRNDCSFLFLVQVKEKKLSKLSLIPTLISYFKVNRAPPSDARESIERMVSLSKKRDTSLISTTDPEYGPMLSFDWQ